ncbi:MAG TPA: hypothetical protein VIS75_00610, partial [Chitinophagaceae bacterium]
NVLNAQPFQNRSKLDSVKQAGFYSIDLNAELCSYLKADFSDLRIANEKEGWVPHIIQETVVPLNKKFFHEFSILKNQLIDSGKTEIILKNTSNKEIYNLKLFIKNAAVSRLATLSGSKNGQDWFIIDDKLLLRRSYESTTDEFVQELSIPLSSYPFFKLVIDNNQNDPLNITRVGFYEQFYFQSLIQYNQNPLPILSQKDSSNQTLVTLRWNRPVHIERLHVFVKGQKFYNRALRICLPGEKGNEPGEVIGHFRLASFTDSIFDIPRTKTDQLFLIIKNDDNPPLHLTKIESEQTITYALTYIDKPGSYHLLLNNKNIQAPNFDLVLFNDSIPSKTEWLSLSAGSVTDNETPVIIAKKINRWWIWPAILLAIAALGYISFSLTRDMRKRES